MAGKRVIERCYWFHGQVKNHKYPNAKILSLQYEISHKQAQRDIDFIKYSLGAPLIYNNSKKGYEYEREGYQLPPIWFAEQELYAFCLALRLASAVPDRKLKEFLNLFLRKIIEYRSLSGSIDLNYIEGKISVKNIQYYKVNESVFRDVLNALFNQKAIEIKYYSPHKHEETTRIVFPLHLLCYIGCWHLIAYCITRKGLRDFALSRIKDLKYVNTRVNLPSNLPSIKDYIRENFGIMTGKQSIEVCIKFNPNVSQWVSEMIWHAAQDTCVNSNGSMTLKFPVADFREIVHEILKYGSNAEVISPIKLRELIKEEILKMQKIY